MTIPYIIDLLFQIYIGMLLVRILGSWIPEFQRTKFMQFIAFYTDPYLNVFRKFIPPVGMMDFSPIVAFLLLGVVRSILHSFLG